MIDIFDIENLPDELELVDDLHIFGSDWYRKRGDNFFHNMILVHLVPTVIVKIRKRGTLPIHSYRGSGKPLGNKQESPRRMA